MKRYLLFGSDIYYACGGWEDFIHDFDSLEDAIDIGNNLEDLKYEGIQWWHIVDLELRKIVNRSKEQSYGSWYA